MAANKEKQSDLSKLILQTNIRHMEAWFPPGLAPGPTEIARVTAIPTNHTAAIELTGNVAGPPAVALNDWSMNTLMASAGKAPGAIEMVGLYDVIEIDVEVADNTDAQIAEFLSRWSLKFKSSRATQGFNMSNFAVPGYAPGPAGSAEIGASPGVVKRCSFKVPLGFWRVNYKNDKLQLENVTGVGAPLTTALGLTVRARKSVIMDYSTADSIGLIGAADTCAPSMDDILNTAAEHRNASKLVDFDRE